MLVTVRVPRELKLPISDSIMLATAHPFDAMLRTQSADFAGQPGVRYVAKAVSA